MPGSNGFDWPQVGSHAAVRTVKMPAGWHGWENPLVRWGVLAVMLPIVWLILSTPLSDGHQLGFGLACFLSAMFLRHAGPLWWTQILIILSLVASTRYMYWRITETMTFDSWSNAFFGSGLSLAELYAWLSWCWGTFRQLGR